MTQAVARRVIRDVEDAAEEVQRSLKKAGARIADDAPDALGEAAHRLAQSSRKLAADARRQGAVIGARAVAEAKARPLAPAAIAGGVIALAALVLFGRSRRA